jgi:RNA polymerase sigma-70 factor (ECF subfamily)
MFELASFQDLLRRIRAGDEQAAAELVRHYEPLIRRAVRVRLEDQRLCRLFDSMDICQSVLASFFVRTAAGQYDLEQPEQLLKLLVRMARNKLASAARGQYRDCRDQRRVQAGAVEQLDMLAAATPTPSAVAAGKDLLDQVRQRLSDEERQSVNLRGQGLTWPEIAAQMGGTAQARRVQLARAVERVSRELGLDEDSDE